jgi:hypothetical protein
MNFNFNSLSEQNFTSNSGQYLRPYDIYEVNLTNIEKTEMKGKKDPDATYPVIALEFTGCGDNKGVFTTNLFIPTSEKDMERPVFKNNEGHEYNRPSRFEQFQFTLMQIVHALNPTGEEKIKANGSKIKTIDQFIELIIKALSGKDKVKTYLKLVGRNDNGVVYAALPDACGLNKSGEVFPTNFIGSKENLFFTNYEITQQKNYQNAKPTKVKDETDDKKDNSSDINLDNIEL